MKQEISNSVEPKTRYVNDVKAAEIADLSPQTLRNWRLQGRGPAYVKLGRAVRYSLNDLIAWLEARRIKGE
jgi:hypothetical protein